MPTTAIHPTNPNPVPQATAVLITRPATDAAATAEKLAHLHWQPITAPCLTIETLTPCLPKAAAILITSANALPALTATPTPLLAVGDATAARARALGFTRVESAGRDAEALAALAAARLNPADGPLLLAVGAGQGGPLAVTLRAHGFRVLRRVAYRACPVRAFPAAAAESIQAGTLHAALFLSADTARIFVRLLPAALRPALASIIAAAIGPAAADALKPLPWRAIRVAARPTLDDTLALL